MSDAAPLKCPRCGAVLGQIVERDGAPRLRVSGGHVRAWVFECDCGRDVHWSATARQLDKLLCKLEKENAP